MAFPIQITFRGMATSTAMAAEARRKAEEFSHLSDRIVACHVVLEAGHGKKRLYRVRVDLRVPGRDIVVEREPSAVQAGEEVYAALRDAFDAARRQLEDHLHRLRA